MSLLHLIVTIVILGHSVNFNYLVHHLGYLSMDNKIYLFRIPFWIEVTDLLREHGGGYKFVPLCPVTHTKILCVYFLKSNGNFGPSLGFEF